MTLLRQFANFLTLLVLLSHYVSAFTITQLLPLGATFTAIQQNLHWFTLNTQATGFAANGVKFRVFTTNLLAVVQAHWCCSFVG